jgi:hypothetical protein
MRSWGDVDDPQLSAAGQVVSMPADTATEVSEDRSAVVDVRAHLQPSAAENERPTLEGAGDLAYQDTVCAGRRQRFHTGGKVWGSAGREAPKTIERVELQLQRDLRPPGVVLDNEVGFKVEPTRRGNRLDVLHADLTVAALPARDGRLSQSEAVREIALGEASPAAGHQNMITAAHTETVSAVWTEVWT